MPKDLRARVVLLIAVLALWLISYVLVFSGWAESRTQATLYDKFRNSVAQEITPFGGSIVPGTPIAVFEAPSVGLRDLVAVEGTSSAVMRAGPGHRRDTPFPGQPGVSVFYGKSRAFGAPFRRLGELHKGSLLSVTTGQGIFNYQVNASVRAGDTVPLSALSAPSRLTLVSSVGSGVASLLTPDDTITVLASLRGQVVSPPGSRPASVPDDESVMASDTSTLQQLLIWLEGLALALAAVTWARFRWGPRQASLAGIPVVLALLWGATGAAAALLPNLF